MATSLFLTLAPPRGIGVTLNPKGGGQIDPTRKLMFMIVFRLLFIFFFLVHYNREKMAQKLGLYLF